MKRILPTWCKEVKKSMIDDDINVTELAERVGFSRNYVSGVVNGRVYAPEIAKVIGEDRHVTVPYTDSDDDIEYFSDHGIEPKNIEFISTKMSEKKICNYLKKQCEISKRKPKELLSTWER